MVESRPLVFAWAKLRLAIGSANPDGIMIILYKILFICVYYY